MKDEIAGKVDILLFNPPYVVTPTEEMGGTDISAAWAGGINGRQVIDQLLPQVSQLLSERGVFYLLVIEENLRLGYPDDITKAIPGYTSRVVLNRKSGPERLSVLCYSNGC